MRTRPRAERLLSRCGRQARTLPSTSGRYRARSYDHPQLHPGASSRAGRGGQRRPSSPRRKQSVRTFFGPTGLYGHLAADPRQNECRAGPRNRHKPCSSPVAQPAGSPALRRRERPVVRPALGGKEERMLARSWLTPTARLGQAAPVARRAHSARAIVATSPQRTSATATFRWRVVGRPKPRCLGKRPVVRIELPVLLPAPARSRQPRATGAPRDRVCPKAAVRAIPARLLLLCLLFRVRG